MKKNNLKNNVLNFLFYGGIICLLVLGLNAKVNNEIPSIFGYAFMHVTSGSMEPTIMTNDVVIGHKVSDSEEIDINGIYIYEGTDGMKIIHRIILEDENHMYIFQGDNNPIADFYPVLRQKIEFKYLFHIPKLGYLVLLFKNPLFYVAIAALYFIYEGIAYLVAKKKKKKEESLMDSSEMKDTAEQETQDS